MSNPTRLELVVKELPTLYQLQKALFDNQKLRFRLQQNGGEFLEILVFQVRRADMTESWEVLGRPVGAHQQTHSAWFRTDLPQGWVELTPYEEGI